MYKSSVLKRLLFAILILLVLLSSTECWAKRKKKSAEESLQASVKREVVLGDKIAEEIAKNMKFNEDPIYTARVRGIFNKLTPWTTRPLPYKIYIVKEKSPNAFCVPGGNIYVTTGLLNFVRSDAELAFVIAHELAHVNGKHVIVQMERNQKLSLAALAVAIASRGAGAAIMLSNIAAVAMANAYSRDLEQEADLNGADLAERAGYDLIAGVTVMESLAEEELKQPWFDPGVYRDHPKISERIRYIADVVEKKGYKLHRKYVLKLLIPTLTEEGGNLIFKIDSTEISRAQKTPETLKSYETALQMTSDHLQMETPAYDIRVSSPHGHGGGVYAGVKPLYLSTFPGGTDGLETIRKRFLIALNEARKKHPMADYAM